MDYRDTETYRNKSNTGFWLIALFSIVLTGYMAYSHFIAFADNGVQTIADSYMYNEMTTSVESQATKSSTVFSFICGVLFVLLLLSTVVSALTKNVKALSISFFSAIILSLVIFVINEFKLYL